MIIVLVATVVLLLSNVAVIFCEYDTRGGKSCVICRCLRSTPSVRLTLSRSEHWCWWREHQPAACHKRQLEAGLTSKHGPGHVTQTFPTCRVVRCGRVCR
ncbi:hypothetical protein LZ31DRAFT_177882 [Colletotrichum somersetense]|nr:hypothetical protein LZ31DRAFT_177882 [Colletotrichum somersetense]